MPKPPITRDTITAALKECGPMTVLELVEYLGFTRTKVDGCITQARANHPGRFFRIVRYRKQVGIQGREAAVYGAGPGPDAPRPAFDDAHKREIKHRHYQGNRALWAARRKSRTGRGAANPWAGLVPMARRSP